MATKKSGGIGARGGRKAAAGAGAVSRRASPPPAENFGDYITLNGRRVPFGGNLKLLLSDTTVLSFEDMLYVRGETRANRTKNYFKATLDSGLGLPFIAPGITQTIRLSFERGNTPPFATPDVNSFQSGLRFRWSNRYN